MTSDRTIEDKNRWKMVTGLYSRIERLHQRQEILSTIREDFNRQGFLEVETPVLVKTTCPDSYIDSIQVEDSYLITSTEYQIKRMIAGGFEKIYTLSKNFRANDRGRFHSIEFTMLEWGSAYETLRDIEQDAVQFIRQAFQKLYPNKHSLNFNGSEIDFMKTAWEHLTVREAFKHHLSLDHLEDFSLEVLLRASKKAKISIPQDFQKDHSLVISYLLDLLQSHLGKTTPTFLCEWPIYLTSSAPLNLNDLSVADRSELYIGGIEIANGFPFLRDPQQQRALFEQQLNKRKELGKPNVAIDERYIASLKDLPPGAGMALGVDRLAMVLTGATQLADVQPFDWDEL